MKEAHSKEYRTSSASIAIVLSAMFMFFSLNVKSAGLDLKSGDWAVGFQSGFTSYGISAKYHMSEKLTVQGVLGTFGALNVYSVRGLYNFTTDDFWEAYGFGGVGLWSWDGDYYNDDESNVGLAAGVGIDWDVRSAGADLPPIFLSSEIGIGMVSFDYYNFSTFSFGFGVHYRFE